ncbi:MAG: acyl-ACP--UDP-N-acetylglucosamine O-acyltransferase [Planctomycetes bacterium]|nr:acyl-ACP--UDP-N-acetylglucosamine O-acyltransferase [Planctomycetota bacterium]
MENANCWVDPTAEIGRDVKIGPFATVGAHARIGDGTIIDSYGVVGPNTILGKRNRIHPFAVIGGDPQDVSWKGDEAWLEVGDDNVFREGVTVNRGTSKERRRTILGNHNYLMACSHVGHDCVLEDHIVIANAVLLGGHVRVESHVWFGGMCAAHHYVTVGRHAFIGGLTRLVADLPPFMLAQGMEGKVFSVNVVGIRRRGFSEEAIEALEAAHRVLFRQKVGLVEARRRLAEDGRMTEEVEYLLAFLDRRERGSKGRARQPAADGTE